MSTKTNNSAWSPEEGDSLENIDKEIQLVSTSSESRSIANNEQEIEPVKKVDLNYTEDTLSKNAQYYNSNFANNKILNSKLHSSCDNICVKPKESKSQGNDDQSISRSSTFASFKCGKKNKTEKYSHIHNKVKQQFLSNKHEATNKNFKATIMPESKEDIKRKEYLEEINKQLMKELEEKNAILSLLQDNYEHLLFKYAEAQNRIDELRFKCMTDNRDTKTTCASFNHSKTDKSPVHLFHNNDFINSALDTKCQRGKSKLLIKVEEPSFENTNNVNSPISRPLSLPLDNNNKLNEKDMLLSKAATPTDSEGLSSVITSMSGHSKILNSLDEENHINKKPSLLKCSGKNFILEENSLISDPFDKVKNWQNSLPPLEQIETPESTLYNVNANKEPADYGTNGILKYNEITSPNTENDYVFLEESCPPSWRDEHVQYSKMEIKNRYQTISLPNTLEENEIAGPIYKKKNCDSNNEISGSDKEFQSKFVEEHKNDKPIKSDIPSACIIQKRQKPPLLRCLSLPAYDYDSVKSGNSRNGFYIPPLDLTNVTLSDEESYCQQNYYLTKSNATSYVTSKGDSIDWSSQTSQSVHSCNKNKIRRENFSGRLPRQTVNKSTSITPEKNVEVDSIFATQYNRIKSDSSRYKSPETCTIECTDCCRDNSQNWCSICGESISRKKSDKLTTDKSNSCESVHSNNNTRKQSSAKLRSKPPFRRSMSFNSDAHTAKYGSPEEPIICKENLENFESYTRNLKARSQVVINALTAHIKNS